MTKLAPPRLEFVPGNVLARRICALDECDEVVLPDCPHPICLAHARTMHAYYVQHVQDFTAEPYAHPAKQQARRSEKVGRVYFIRRGDFIKIGWSGNPERRLTDLDGDALLHDQPGTMADEALLHRAFEIDRVPGMGREWFYDSATLQDFIAKLRIHRNKRAA